MQYPGLGHNGGPELERSGWKVHCWKTARAALLPTLPIEVVRRRVKRAQELGLPYKTYAGIRAASGHDVIAFLFSSNGLRPDYHARLPQDVCEKLQTIAKADRIVMAQGHAPELLLSQNHQEIDVAGQAPVPFAKFARASRQIARLLGPRPRSGVVLISSDAPWEREWLVAGKLGAEVSAESFFKRAAS